MEGLQRVPWRLDAPELRSAAHPVETSRRKGKRAYIQYINAFRGLAIILVVLTHVAANRWFFYVAQNATVFYVFISGFLFSHLLDDNETVWSFWSRKAGRLALPYFVAIVPGIAYIAVKFPEKRSLSYLLNTTLTGVGHMNDAHWYIPFIVILFSLYPALCRLNRNGAALSVAAGAWVVVSVFTFRSENNANPLMNAAHFGSVFLVGMLFSRYRCPIEAFVETRRWWIVGASLLVFATSLPFVAGNFPLTMQQILANHILAVDYTFVGKLALVPAILILLKLASDTGWELKPFSFLADLSFGLFFWHFYVIEAVDHLTHRWFPAFAADQSGALCAIIVLQLTAVFGVLGLALILIRKVAGSKSLFLIGC